MKARARGLLARIVISFFLLSAFIVVLLTALAHTAIVGGTRSAVIGQLNTLATAKEQTLGTWMAQSLRKVVNAGREASLSETLEASDSDPHRIELRAHLSELQRSWPELGELLVATDPDGLVLAATSPELDGQYRNRDSWFVAGRRGLFVQSVYPSPVSLRPTLTIAVPVRTPGGRLVVLAANLDLQVLDGIVADTRGPFRETRTYLVDRFSSLVSSERFGSERYPRGVHSQAVDAAVAGRDGSGTYTSYDGTPVVGVYRWLEDHELALLVEVPVAEAYRATRRLTALIASTGLVVVAVLAAGVLVLARRIVQPILMLKAGAKKVASGDLRTKVLVTTQDEIGDLADSFNEMTARLVSLYAKLDRDQARFRALIEASSDAVMVLDREATITYASPTWEKLADLDRGASMGSSFLDIVHPDDLGRVREVFQGLVNENVGAGQSIELRLRGAEGQGPMIELAARNLLGQTVIDGILVSARDITERRRLEDELTQAQKMEAVGRLAGGIAHDFNNILTAILGYAELLATESGLGKEATQDVAEIVTAATRAAALTQQLLAYGRKQVLKPAVLDLNELIVQTQSLLRRVIGEHIAVRTELAQGLPSVRADPGQLQRVVLNLALNSRDAMPDGGTLTLRTFHETEPDAGERERDRPEVVLEVSDTGVGMDEETRKRLFEPFFTTKEMGKGTGLGLATVYGIVRQSGGRVTVRSAPGEGTAMRIYLPAVDTHPIASAEGVAIAHEGGSESILLVEDEDSVRKLMQETLTRAGYGVRSTSSPREALALFDNDVGVDILITDVVMPGMSGRALADLAARKHPGIRVLFVSGYAEDERFLQGVSTHSLSFLQKPFTPQDLAARVRQLLDGGDRAP